MPEKRPGRMVASYELYGEDNESLQACVRVGIPGEMNESKFLPIRVSQNYVVSGSPEDTNRLVISNDRKYVGHLSRSHGGRTKNSGLPESRNVGGNGGVIVGRTNKTCNLIIRRFTTSKPYILIRGLAKDARTGSSEKVKPAGIMELEKLIENNLNDPTYVNYKVFHIVKDVDNLLAAYNKIKSYPGNSTPGSDETTLDGLDLKWFKETNRALGSGAFQFKPARRVEIPKPKGGTRPLGVASPREKVVQESIRMVLEAVFEPSFKDCSHGFRPKKSCHTAHNDIKMKFAAVNWFIEGDISKCFDTFDHSLLIAAVSKRIPDPQFIQLLYKALKAGYLFQGKLFQSPTGTPQGSVISPILCNVYLQALDCFMEELISKFNIGKRRKTDPAYRKLTRMPGRTTKVHKEGRNSKMGKDIDYKRARYVRYADDFLIGVIGSKEDCIEIRKTVADFLRNELKMELNLEKTKITHAATERARFLGMELRITPNDKKPYRQIVRGNQTYLARTTTRPQLLAPISDIIAKLRERGMVRKGFSATRWGKAIPFEIGQIVNLMRSIWLGLWNFYGIADNAHKLGVVFNLVRMSCVLTLASKLKLKTKAAVFKKFGRNLTITVNEKGGKRTIAQFEGRPSLVRKRNLPRPGLDPLIQVEQLTKATYRSRALMNSNCLICKREENIEMHHLKHIRTIGIKLDYWGKMMARMNRKQIPVCRACHNEIHRGNYSGKALGKIKSVDANNPDLTAFFPGGETS